MKTELFIYKSNLVQNFNFTGSNLYVPAKTNVPVIIWDVNTCWNISNGYAECTSSDTTSLAQGSLFEYNTDYKVSVNVTAISGGNLYLYVGTNNITITTPGIYTATINSGAGDDLEIFADLGVAAIVNWVNIVELPELDFIELQDDVSIPITYNIADIRDPSKRQGSYSKTINIPGTVHNNLVFNQIYEIEGDSNFNPNKKVKAVIYYNGDEQLVGYLQLKTINRKENGFSNYDLIGYEVVLIGGVTDIFTDMGTTLLSELGWSEYNHDYTATNIADSWYGNIKKNATNFTNITNGPSYNITSVQLSGDGRAQINFSSPHGFLINDLIGLSITSGTGTSAGYEGDHRVFSIVSTTAIKLYFPFIAGTGTLTGTAFRRNSLGDGYLYPMVYYGTHSDGTNHNGIDWKITDFLPAFYLKTYLDKIASKFNYQFSSAFFNTNDFKRLILSPSIKDFRPSNAQLNRRAFQASKTTPFNGTYRMLSGLGNSTGYSYSPTLFTGQPGSVTFNDDSTPPNFDNYPAYSPSTGKWTCPVTATYELSTSLNFKHSYTLPSGYSVLTSPTGYVDFFAVTVIIRDHTASTNIATVNKQYVFKTSANINESFTLTAGPQQMIAGHQYGVIVQMSPPLQINVAPGIGSTSPVPGQTLFAAYSISADHNFYNTPTAAPYNDGDSLDMISSIPNMTCKDFMLNMINMFNLYIEPNKNNDKILLIEPRDAYYNINSTENWTTKLDLENDIIIQPLAELNAKTYEYKFKDDKATLNDLHLKQSGFNYGDFIFSIDNDFVSNKNTTQLTVSSGVLMEFPSFSNRIIMGIYSDNNGNKERIEGNPRISFWGIASSAGSISPTWNLASTISGDGKFGLIQYPYAGHLDKVRGPYRDYQYGYPEKISFVSNQWTSANLYNLYYKNMIDDYTSRNNKLVTCNIFIKPSDISKLNFRSKYLIDGHYFRLNKIIDYVPGSITSTKCEFSMIENTKIFVPTLIDYTGPSLPFVADYLDGFKLPRTPDISLDANPTIMDQGYANNISKQASNKINVLGDNNTVGPYSENISLIGSNNVFVYGGLKNVTVINSDNVIVKESNTVVINGLVISGSGALVNSNINYIDAGLDVVLSPFNSVSTINYIDAGKDAVLNLGSSSLTNYINGGSDVVL